MSSAGDSRSAVAISLMKLAVRPMMAIRAANWQARMTVQVTPKAPSCGAWNRIVETEPVSIEREGRRLWAVFNGKWAFGNGAIGGGGKELLEAMVGSCVTPLGVKVG